MKVNYIGIACLAVLLLTACDESKYELENLVPEEYHKVLYINKSGTQELTLYNTGELNTYAFSVYKGGSDPSLTASGEIAVHSQEEVDVLYGADYRIIPSGSYSMDTDRLDFASEERSKVVTLSLSTDLIGAAMEANPEATYVLPLYLTSEKDSVNADKSELFIRITDVLTPAMGFTDTDIQPLSYTYGFNTESVEVGFGLDTNNNWDVECLFVVDPGYVTAYNAENGTAYKLFPEGNYSFEDVVTLPTGTSTTDLAVTLNGNGLTPGEYMLPIRLDNVSLFNIAENAVYPLVVRVVGIKLDRAGWSIQANTEERTGEGAGVSGVFLTKTCVDITNPKVIRATMGSVYRIPFFYVEDVVSLKQKLPGRGIRFFAAHLQGKNSYDRESYEDGTAFLIGNEGKGLTDQAADAADCLIRIPMCGQVESLNAAMAAGILMYEAARQRRG